MKLDDILPILVLLVYVALVFVKHRKTKADAQKKAASKSPPTGVTKIESQKTASQKPAASLDRAPPKQVDSPDRPAPRLFPLIGERLRRFFADLEQQFREELEKARSPGLEPESPGYPLFDYQGNPIDPEPGESFTEPEPESGPALHPVAHGALDKPPKARHRSGCFRNRSRSRQKIRNAIVWSEILEPPLALRRGKRPWDP
ncbi:MAG: hypothetical protein JEZ12_07335 [Desulfobacterium sp.]|nr:hypothetical protein [Desulfobacterium sp.]